MEESATQQQCCQRKFEQCVYNTHMQYTQCEHGNGKEFEDYITIYMLKQQCLNVKKIYHHETVTEELHCKGHTN